MIRRRLAPLLARLFGASRSAPPAQQPPSQQPPPEQQAPLPQQLPPGHPAVFNDAFTAGRTTTADGDTVTFDTHLLGTFRLPSGRLVACDPLICDGDYTLPLAKPVPRGEFPLTLAVRSSGSDRGRVVFARLAFSAEPVVRWEMALVEGDDPSALQPGEIFGYAVDTATGAFMDLDAFRAFTLRKDQDEGYAEELIDQMAKGGQPERLLFSMGAGSVAMFDSGGSDGVYATYWGYDAAGNLAAVLTDFYQDWDREPDDG